MLLTEYLFDLIKAIDEYSKSGYIFTSELNIDARSEKIGLIKGSIVFIVTVQLTTETQRHREKSKDKPLDSLNAN